MKTNGAGDVSAVDALVAAMPSPHRATLTALRDTLRTVLPHADECVKYGMPCFAVQGIGVAGYDAFKEHCSYFPMSGSVLGHVTVRSPAVATTKGTLQFPPDHRLPVSLVRRLVKVRLAEISDVAGGTRYEFYPDGALKALGPMKSGMPHGHWKWFRRDASLMRTGQFRAGQQVGAWTTYDRDGAAVKVTHF